MTNSTLMIRMIDVVFILLFGFIAVSQIGSNAAIEPPKSNEAEETAPDDAHTIVIGVTREGTFPVESGNVMLKNIAELQRYLRTKASESARQGEPIGVRIRANWDSSVEHSLAIAKLCRDMGIPKGLDVVKLNMN
jgi:biopolymer transport protein ExbD